MKKGKKNQQTTYAVTYVNWMLMKMNEMYRQRVREKVRRRDGENEHRKGETTNERERIRQGKVANFIIAVKSPMWLHSTNIIQMIKQNPQGFRT